MAEQYVYRIWCVTEGAYVETGWETTEPTECPNDPGHTIDTDSIAIIKTTAPYLSVDGSNTPEADIDFNAKKITNLANPTTDQEAATKTYADNFSYFTYLLYDSTSKPYLEIGDTSYYTMAAFLYDGSDTYPISELKAVVSKAGSSGTCYLRIYDTTNNNTVAEVTWTSSSVQIVTDSSLTNVPTGQAIFEIQGKKVGGDNGRYWAIQLK
jgi:hypothetical protein